MNNFENRDRGGIAPDLWDKYHHRNTSRWQRFLEGFEAFNQRVENFFMWYWHYAFVGIAVMFFLYTCAYISYQPDGWYHVGRSLGETFLGW